MGLMTEHELQIARCLGASSFLIYTFIKNHPGASKRDIEIETGLSENCVGTNLIKLKETNVVEFELQWKKPLYKENKNIGTWRLQ
jgi:hypothetical protein